MKRECEYILRLRCCSVIKPVKLNNIDNWCKENKEDILSELYNGECDDENNIDEEFENCVDETDNQLPLLLAYLLDKDLIKIDVIKYLFKGQEYYNTCYGEWRKDAESKLGIKFYESNR